MTKQCFQIYKLIKNPDGLYELNIEIMGSYEIIALEQYLANIYEIIDLKIDSFYKDKDISIVDANNEIAIDFPLSSDDELSHLWDGDEKYLYIVRGKLRDMIYSYIDKRIKHHNYKLEYNSGRHDLNPV